MLNHEFDDFFGYLRTACAMLGGTRVSEDHKAFWKIALERYSFQDAVAAVNRWVSTNEFAPKPASLANMIRQVESERRSERELKRSLPTIRALSPQERTQQAEDAQKYMRMIDWLKAHKPPETHHISYLLGVFLQYPNRLNPAQIKYLRDVHAIDREGQDTGRYSPEYEDWFESQGKSRMEERLGIPKDYEAA